ncbi:unnamed protein product [Miscanthus lutarioriparius]|uniref:WRKY domain-containing protein n=1 Tax=Miscanthus lutarioriparius TaxID=422564 RepID=A0A811QR96_9POAL|nr:unnamed protein product [Miscanthus lutarioriparius]
MACVADRDAAVREVAQVYELIKVQQPLLLLHSQQPPPSTTQLAQSLLSKALRALNVALSVMKQQQQPAAGPPAVTPISVVKAKPHQFSPPSPASADTQAAIVPSTATRGAKRRSSVAMDGKKKIKSSSWATVTAVPYDDGYEWRKYGEKKINGTLFTRSYFRCTYKGDAGCQATKHVQQVDNNSDDPPMFHVTYNNDHTCNSCSKAAAANTGSSSNNLAALLAGCCNMKQEPTGQHAAAAAMNMKQKEPPLLLPPLVDLQPSACLPHEQIPQCQEPLFPVSMEQQFCGALRDDDGEIPSATGSFISGETSWDGYSGDMAAAEDDPLHDLERFLFMDMDY